MNADFLALLALLVAGHLLGDFVFQTNAMVRGKREARGPLRAHAAEIALVQALIVLPFFPSFVGLVCVLAIAVTHYFIDAGKLALDRRWPRPLTWFVLDQCAHVAVLLLAALIWDVVADPILFGNADSVAACAWLAGVLAFNVNGGSAIVAATLAQLRPASDTRSADEGAAGAGRLIGILERLLILFAVLAGEWAAVGLVLAAKSIARFKELENRDFAELYLVGTLASVLVAVVSALALTRVLAL
ncbi:MAG: hypothetical protein DHS20C15_05150 [Planctomycetota bacterium]|nr:MAG: hypothetical protein DHS20C15_05150 [Planctomycetota bacterium]